MQAVLDGYGLVEHRGGCVVVPRNRWHLSAGQRPSELCTDYKSEFSLGNRQYCENGAKREQRTFRYARMHVEVAHL